MLSRHSRVAQMRWNSCVRALFVPSNHCSSVTANGKEIQMRFPAWSISAAVLMAAWQLSVPAASAQVESPSPRASAPTPSIPDHKLDAAAAALERVASLKQDYEQRLAASPPEPDK